MSRTAALLLVVVLHSLVSACASAPPAVPDVAAASKPLRLGLGTPTGAEDAARDADALQAAFSKALGTPVTARVFEGYDPLVEAIVKGEIDVAWLPPLGYVRAAQQAAVTPLRKAKRHGKSFYKSVLFTRVDQTKLSSPADAKGKRAAWVSASSTSGYLFPKALLLEAGLDPAKLFTSEEFLGDHAAVCQAVLDGKVDVGASFTDDLTAASLGEISTCYSILADSRPKLKVIAASEPIPNDVLVARAGLEPATQEKVSRALDALAADASASELFGRLFEADGFEPATSADYDAVRKAAAFVQMKQ